MLSRLRSAASVALLALLLPVAGWAGAPDNLARSRPNVTAPARDSAALARRIDAILSRPALRRAHWGVEVRDASTGQVLYARNAERLFVPASSLKLVVSATAAHHLPADYRFRTFLHGTGPVANGVLRGDLVLVGRGDPLLSGRYAESRVAIFEALADSLRARGIRRVTGAVVGDDSWWDADRLRGDWEAYDTRWWYAAPVGALGFNDNSIDFRVEPGAHPGQPARITALPASSAYALENRTRTVAAGGAYTLDFERLPGGERVRAYGEIPVGAAVRTESFAVRDPARYAATVLRETLVARGISVEGAVRVVSDSAASPARGAAPLVEHLSLPLPQTVGPILQTSQNWFAEQLLKTVGREVRGEGSWAAGLAVERDFLLREAGLDSTDFVLRDGSGLSSGNLVSPRGMVRLLDYVRRTPRQAVVRDALPVAGRSGSLRARLTDLAGRVAAKTGYIGNVDSLTGFVTLADGTEVIFYIVSNNSGQPSARVKQGIDDVVREIAALGR